MNCCSISADGIADRRDTGARSHLGDAGPKMWQQEIAMLACRINLSAASQAACSSSRQMICSRMPKPISHSRPWACANDLISAMFSEIFFPQVAPGQMRRNVLRTSARPAARRRRDRILETAFASAAARSAHWTACGICPESGPVRVWSIAL